MMKKYAIIALSAVMTIAACTNDYDDSDLQGRLDKVQADIEKMEALLEGYRAQIETYQALMAANADGTYVTAVNEIKEGDKVIGYEICLEGREPVRIMNGLDGKPGEDGPDGYSPKVGVAEKDGRYYWTIDGRILEDSPASPDPGMLDTWNGETPEVFIRDGKWYVRTSSGEQELGPVSASDALLSDEVFGEVSLDGGILKITLEDGTVIDLPILQEYGVLVEATESPLTWKYEITGKFDTPSLNVFCPSDWSAQVTPEADVTEGNIALVPDSSVTAGTYTFNVLVSDGTHSAATAFTINYNGGL